MICAEERYAKILDLLKEKEFVSTTELISLLDTSRETVRRDLNTLAERGALVKTHGGATSKERAGTLYDTPVLLRETANVLAKREICEYAARFIQDNDHIFIDSSSTAAHLINYIPKNHHITLITYSIRLAYEIARLKAANWTVICLGGVLDYNTLSTGNYLTLENLARFRPSKSFLSCHGIDERFDVTDSYTNDVEIKRTLLRSSQETFLLADHSKLMRNGVILIDDARTFDHLIVDGSSDMDFVEALRKHGCEVTVVPGVKSNLG